MNSNDSFFILVVEPKFLSMIYKVHEKKTKSKLDQVKAIFEGPGLKISLSQNFQISISCWLTWCDPNFYRFQNNVCNIGSYTTRSLITRGWNFMPPPDFHWFHRPSAWKVKTNENSIKKSNLKRWNLPDDQLRRPYFFQAKTS